MKKTSLIYLILVNCLFTGCNKILDRPPLDRITDKQLTFTATEMRLYSNQFYLAFPGWEWEEYSGGIFWDDLSSDNMAQGSYDYNSQISGTATVSDEGGWDWENIRAVNYFLTNYQVTKEPFQAVSTYIGEMYFWRAWFYYDMLKQFGDLPWYSHPLATSDSTELLAPRLPRYIIADSILADLDKAAGLLSPPAQAEPLRINRDVALAFKSRVALYEGSWEKYHNGTVFGVSDADPSKYFRQAAEAANTIIESGHYSIQQVGSDPRWFYWRLFNQQDLSGNKEIILWKKYDRSLGFTHHGQNYFPYEGGNTGITKQLVDAYLSIDGKPISISPLYMGDDSISGVIQNRDPRLSQTIYVRGYPRIVLSGDTTSIFSEPDINLPGQLKNTTGYQIFKGCAPDDASQAGSTTASIIFRYGEVLLNYAEAKTELDEATQDVIDISINQLRDRVGMPHLAVAVGFTDPNWDFPSLSPLLNEVRRERRVELAIEGYRFNDLMRWSAAHLIKQPLYGAKYSQFTNKHFDPPLTDVPVGVNGYIQPYLNSPAANGWQFDENKNYLLPLPSNQLAINPNLKQNPGY